MPQYKVTDPQTGRTITLTGDSPPTEQELEEVFASLPAAKQEAAPARTPQAQPARTWGDTAIDALPAIGGTIGGFAGGTKFNPVGAAMSAVGGMAGEGYRQLARNVTELPGAIKDIASNIMGGHGAATMEGFRQGAREGSLGAAKEGGKQAAFGAVGGVVGDKVLRPAAAALTRHVFKPSSKIVSASPTVVTDILESGIAPTAKGATKAKALTDGARQLADELVTSAERGGTSIPMHEVTDALFTNPRGAGKAPYEYLKGLGLPASGVKKFDNFWDDLVEGERALGNISPRGTLKPTRVQTMRRAHGQAAKDVMEGAGVDAPLQRQLHGAIEAGARDTLEKAIPGFGAANAETAKRLAVQNTVNNLLKKQNNTIGTTGIERSLLNRALLGLPLGYIAGPGGFAGAAALIGGERVLTNPRVQAAIGRGAWGAANKQLPANAMRAVDAEVSAPAKPLNKKQVDSLYEKYSKGR